MVIAEPAQVTASQKCFKFLIAVPGKTIKSKNDPLVIGFIPQYNNYSYYTCNSIANLCEMCEKFLKVFIRRGLHGKTPRLCMG